MEAARTASLRGHRVVLFEARPQLGGRVRTGSLAPRFHELIYVGDYLVAQLQELGVDIRLSTPGTVDGVLADQPDVVIVATGSVQVPRAIAAPVEMPVLSSEDVLEASAAIGSRCVILDEDGYYEAAAVAGATAANGAAVTLVSRFTEIGREIPCTSRITTLRYLDSAGVHVMPTTWISHNRGKAVTLAHCYTGRETLIEDVDSLVHVGGMQGSDSLDLDLQGAVNELHIIGDAFQPRRIRDAIREGHMIGRSA